MKESKFLIHGQHIRPHDGYTRNDCLGYITETAEEAVTKCLKSYPNFLIHYVELDDSEVEVVKVQSLIWNLLWEFSFLLSLFSLVQI